MPKINRRLEALPHKNARKTLASINTGIQLLLLGTSSRKVRKRVLTKQEFMAGECK